MKTATRILSAAAALTVALAVVAPPPPLPPPPPPWPLVVVTWDPNQEPDIAGYVIYLGEQPGPPYPARIELPLWPHLHGRCEQPILVNHPVTYFRLSAYTASGIEGPTSEEFRWPEA